MMTIETNKVLVCGVSATGVRVAINGADRRLGWRELRRASVQCDADLRRVYGAILREAEAMAADGPVEVSVGRDAAQPVARGSRGRRHL